MRTLTGQELNLIKAAVGNDLDRSDSDLLGLLVEIESMFPGLVHGTHAVACAIIERAAIAANTGELPLLKRVADDIARRREPSSVCRSEGRGVYLDSRADHACCHTAALKTLRDILDSGGSLKTAKLWADIVIALATDDMQVTVHTPDEVL